MNDIAETHLATFTKLALARTEVDRLTLRIGTLAHELECARAALVSKDEEVESLRKMVAHVAGGARGVVL